MGTKINSWFTTMHSTFYKTKTFTIGIQTVFRLQLLGGGLLYRCLCIGLILTYTSLCSISPLNKTLPAFAVKRRVASISPAYTALSSRPAGQFLATSIKFGVWHP